MYPDFMSILREREKSVLVYFVSVNYDDGMSKHVASKQKVLEADILVFHLK